MPATAPGQTEGASASVEMLESAVRDQRRIPRSFAGGCTRGFESSLDFGCGVGGGLGIQPLRLLALTEDKPIESPEAGLDGQLARRTRRRVLLNVDVHHPRQWQAESFRAGSRHV